MLDALLFQANLLFKTVKDKTNTKEVENPIKGPHAFGDVLHHLNYAGGKQSQHLIRKEITTLNRTKRGDE